MVTVLVMVINRSTSLCTAVVLQNDFPDTENILKAWQWCPCTVCMACTPSITSRVDNM